MVRSRQSQLAQAKHLPQILAVALLLCATQQTAATEIVGFVQANREVEVASAESGVLKEVLVKAGDRIEKGQAIARLDDEVQAAQLELAEVLAKSQAEIVKAKAELSTRDSVYKHLVRLSEKGFAQEKELLRAKMDLEVARASLLAREERVTENRQRAKLAELALHRRTIYSPIGGTVSEIHREAGEFVSPLNPQVITVLEVDPVIALFQIGVSEVQKFTVDQPVTVTLQEGIAVDGTVESLGVVAESETVALKIRLPNAGNRILAGQRCFLEIPTATQLSQR